MAIPADRILSQSHRVTPRGLEATREVYCTRAEVENVAWWPSVGMPWEYNPFLKVDSWDYDFVSDHPFDVILKIKYSTQGQYGEDFYSTSMEIDCDVLDTAESCTWESTGTSVDIPVSRIIPKIGYSINVRVPTSPTTTIAAGVGRVNDRIFHGFAPGTMLFLGSTVEESYDQNGTLMFCRCGYKFTIHPWQEQNLSWRTARQKLVDGVPQYYQCDDTEGANYTTDTSMDSEPVYVDGAAGTAGWDRIVRPDGAYTYDSCDLATVLGLPKKIGDG